MGLETGTYISDLVITNPPSGDPTSQGDDHLRLLKTVLKNTFPSASKATYSPAGATKTANYTVLATDQNTLFLINTGGGSFAITLPTLAIGDAGWECSFLKFTSDTNPYFIQGASGSIASGELIGLTKTRRCVPGHRTKALWTGSSWFVDRTIGVPVGTVLEYQGTVLPPVGYEQPNGAVLAAANYPDYNAVKSGGATINHPSGVTYNYILVTE